MMVTDICRDENIFEGGSWGTKPCNIAEEIRKYNENPRRFLNYADGIFVTAYARLQLFRTIYAIGERGHYYSDTDSCKVVDGDRYKRWFEKENARLTEKLNKALKYHKIDPARGRPLTIKGVPKPLGVWDYEGRMLRFKALRAKSYMIETDKGVNITVSGVNKSSAVPYICRGWAQDVRTHEHINDPFKKFDDMLSVPPDYTGKLTHIYIDEEQSGVLTDYLGVTAPFYEKTAIHLEKAGYEMSLALQYIDYLKGFKEWGK